MVSFGLLRRVALLRTDVSEELSASFIKVTKIGELGTTLVVISSYTAVITPNMKCIHMVKNGSYELCNEFSDVVNGKEYVDKLLDCSLHDMTALKSHYSVKLVRSARWTESKGGRSALMFFRC
jgi:hypothetical protein